MLVCVIPERLGERVVVDLELCDVIVLIRCDGDEFSLLELELLGVDDLVIQTDLLDHQLHVILVHRVKNNLKLNQFFYEAY